MSEAEHLSRVLRELFSNPQNGWFPPFTDAIAGLNAPQAAWVPAPGMNSVWALTNHVRFWQELVLLRLRGEPVDRVALGAEDGWPPPADPADERAWQEACHRATALNSDLAALVAGLTGDSSIIVAASPSQVERRLSTPADVFGCLLKVESSGGRDATELLRRRLDPDMMKGRVLTWLPRAHNKRLRQYEIVSEVYGRTSLHRKALLDLVEANLRGAFPRWKRTPAAGLRFLCKADPQAGILGVQLYSNLSPREDERPGTLRRHLACALLTIAGVRKGDVVLDPFMGTGTILRAAREDFGVRAVIGCEIDAGAYDIARRNVKGPDTRLYNISFEDVSIEDLPESVRLVSNLPFGVRFARIPTKELVTFLTLMKAKTADIALLAGREQATALSHMLDLRTKNVLVLGQPAAIVYSPSGRRGVED